MILKLRRTLVRPLGGHHFIEGRVRIEGNTLDEVASKLSDYRINNTIPIGNPKDEILQYYLQKYPYMVDIDDEGIPEPAGDRLKAQWVQWIRNRWGKPLGKAASSKEAEGRSAVCAKCPFNVPIEPTTTEEHEMLRKAFMLRRGHDVPKKLGFCSLHLWDNGSAIFIEAPTGVSGMTKDTAKYPRCWVA
jgi:hypothetical protein